jgi:hypothetical protein
VNDPRLEAMGDTPSSDVCGCMRAEELGRMTSEELAAIQHCETCLEAYRKCQCQTGRNRRAEKEHLA